MTIIDRSGADPVVFANSASTGPMSVPFLALAALLIIGFVINPEFLSATNLANVITRSAFIAIIAVGATFVISSGGLDLSVGSMAAFITGVMIMFMNRLAPGAEGWAIPAGMAMAVLAGLLCGSGERAHRDGRSDRTVHRHARHDGHFPRSHHLSFGRRNDPDR